jgi:cytochrome P450
LEQNHSPDLAINAMHELLRWQTPLSHMRRTATEDAEVLGQTIRAGDKIALWYSSANSDESLFPDGDAIRVERENARRHLAFGYGIHRCFGARVGGVATDSADRRDAETASAGECDQQTRNRPGLLHPWL